MLVLGNTSAGGGLNIRPIQLVGKDEVANIAVWQDRNRCFLIEFGRVFTVANDFTGAALIPILSKLVYTVDNELHQCTDMTKLFAFMFGLENVVECRNHFDIVRVLCKGFLLDIPIGIRVHILVPTGFSRR